VLESTASLYARNVLAFRKCSVELATVTHLVNFSITLGQIQDVWLSAVVTPVYECPEICI